MSNINIKFDKFYPDPYVMVRFMEIMGIFEQVKSILKELEKNEEKLEEISVKKKHNLGIF